MSERAESGGAAASPGGATEATAPHGVGVPGPPTAIALLFVLAVFFWLTGALFPTEIPTYATSALQITGMALMLILVPAYLVAALWLAQRRSLRLVDELRPRLPDKRVADTAAGRIRGALRRGWIPGAAGGFAMGMLNTNFREALAREAPVVDLSINSGQILLWLLIGLVISTRIHTGFTFRGVAEHVELALLEPDRLKAMSRTGVVDVALAAGAMLLSPLQSLDAEFRWYNYQNAFLVVIPTIAFALVWPLQPLHRRNRAERDARLAVLDAQLERLSDGAPATAEDAARLETLLAHRDRLRTARTWPLSMGLLSRV
ncbi:MAG: hypothetical protein HKP30_08740, partial [Myxococcales bacterium]|nr:hypothetical protein [Myxococcales bacterium]